METPKKKSHTIFEKPTSRQWFAKKLGIHNGKPRFVKPLKASREVKATLDSHELLIKPLTFVTIRRGQDAGGTKAL